jgi:hypothetical protein
LNSKKKKTEPNLRNKHPNHDLKYKLIQNIDQGTFGKISLVADNKDLKYIKKTIDYVLMKRIGQKHLVNNEIYCLNYLSQQHHKGFFPIFYES